MKRIWVFVATLIIFNSIIVQAAPYKSVSVCIEDPLFNSCVSQAPIGCTQIFQNGGGGDTDFCNDLLGSGGGVGVFYTLGDFLFINHSVTAAISINLNDTGSSIRAEIGNFTGNVTGDWFDGKLGCQDIQGGPDTDFCTDATGGVGGGSSGINISYVNVNVPIGHEIQNKVVFEGLIPEESVIITQIGISSIVSGSQNLTIDLLKDGAVQNRNSTLEANNLYNLTDISDITYSTSERLGVRIVSAGQSARNRPSGLQIVIYSKGVT